MVIQFLGTSHISEESIEKVKQKISEEKPDVVAVELDEARLHALLSDKRKIPLSAIKQLGLFGFLFQVIGAHLQKQLGKEVKQMPGIDMKTAYLAAKKSGAKIFLIDQPIQITLRKISKINLFEKVRFILNIVGGAFSKEKINFDLRKIPDEKTILRLTKNFRKQFPSFYSVLVTERDNYLANQIKQLERRFPNERILVVLGAGHLGGVRKLLASKTLKTAN